MTGAAFEPPLFPSAMGAQGWTTGAATWPMSTASAEEPAKYADSVCISPVVARLGARVDDRAVVAEQEVDVGAASGTGFTPGVEDARSARRRR